MHTGILVPERGTASDEVLLRLQPGRFLRGRVTTATGQGLEGAELYLRPEVEEERSDRGLLARRVRSGPGGAFVVTGLEARPLRLYVASGNGYADRSIGGLVPVLASERSEDLVIEVPAAKRLAGRCVSDRGGVAKVRVTVVATADPYAAALVATSDARGEFFFERVVDGPLRVTAQFGPYEVVTRVPAAADDVVLEAPKLEAATLRFEVPDGLLVPSSGHWRFAWRNGATLAPVPDFVWQAFGIRDAHASLDVIAARPAAAAFVELRLPGMARSFVPLERAGSALTVQLDAACQLSMRLETPDGQPAAGGQVQVRRVGEPAFELSLRSDEYGSALAEQLPSGSYDISTGEAWKRVEVGAGRGATTVLVAPPPRGDLEVTIAGPEGQAGDLHLFARRSSFHDLRRVRSGETLIFEGLPVGRYGLVLRAFAEVPGGQAGSGTTTKDVEVSAGRRVEARLFSTPASKKHR